MGTQAAAGPDPVIVWCPQEALYIDGNPLIIVVGLPLNLSLLLQVKSFLSDRAMVIRRRDSAEAGIDADAETQITIDFEAEGSSTDAY